MYDRFAAKGAFRDSSSNRKEEEGTNVGETHRMNSTETMFRRSSAKSPVEKTPTL